MFIAAPPNNCPPPSPSSLQRPQPRNHRTHPTATDADSRCTSPIVVCSLFLSVEWWCIRAWLARPWCATSGCRDLRGAWLRPSRSNLRRSLSKVLSWTYTTGCTKFCQDTSRPHLSKTGSLFCSGNWDNAVKDGLMSPAPLDLLCPLSYRVGPVHDVDNGSSKVAWVCFEVVAAAVCGIMMSVLLLACMAVLSESDVPSATAVHSFLRTSSKFRIGYPSITFNAQFNLHFHETCDGNLRVHAVDGVAYAYTSQQLLQQEQEWTDVKGIVIYVKLLTTI